MAKSLKLIVEALLFASDKPLTLKEIHAVLPEIKPDRHRQRAKGSEIRV